MTGNISCIRYQNHQELYDLLFYSSKTRNSLIITATDSMANRLREWAEKEGSQKFDDTPKPWNFIGINILLSKWLKGWYNPELLLEQILLLGDIIEDKDLIVTDDDRRVLWKNRSDILKTSRLLTEIGISPKDIPITNNSEKLLQQVYVEFYPYLKKKIHKEPWRLKDICTVSKPQDELTDIDKSHILDNYSTVYLQGFYYILPLQAELMDGLLSLGKDICFLNNYDKRIPEVFDVYTHNPYFKKINQEKGNIATIDQPAAPQPRLVPQFADVFSSFRKRRTIGIPQQHHSKINVHKYEDIFSFAEAVRSDIEDDEVSMYSPNSNDLTDFFETFFPEQEKIDKNGEARKEHLLSYPIGQYIFTLYNMWDEEQQELHYSIEDVRTCLATGWAGQRSSDGSRLLRLFDKISVFFNGCDTLYDWEQRLDQLADACRKIVPLFDHIPPDSSYVRWHKIMGNPLRQVSVYTLDQHDFDLLKETLDNIFSDARELYQEGEQIDLIQHFARLRKILEGKAAYSNLAKEEREATERILKRLHITSDYIVSCSSNNLSEAMSYFLGGELDQSAEADGQELSTDARSGLSDIEAEFFRAKVRPVHICFCDDKHVPGVSRSYTWPLSKDFFEELAAKLKNKKDQKTDLCDDYIYYMESVRLAGRYLFFLALQFPEIEISWVEEYGNEKLNGTAYLKMLHVNTGKSEDVEKKEKVGNHNRADKILKLNELTSFLPVDLPVDHIPEEIDYNRRFCPLRNIYDYGLQEFPGIENEFQLKFYISMLSRFVNSAIGNISDIDTEQKIHKIFPIGTLIERAQWKVYGRSTKNLVPFPKEYTELEGCSYKMARLYLKYLNKNLVSKLINGKYFKIGDNCKYCPHKDVCYWRFKEDEIDDDRK